MMGETSGTASDAGAFATTQAERTPGVTQKYRVALLDWLACAYGGRQERAARAARAAGLGPLERVAWLATAGHILDFDDTYLPGIAHLSAPTAPAAITLAADLGRTVGDAVAAYAAGFEAMGALSRRHDLYAGGWHPTAVCGAFGAAHAAAHLLELDPDRAATAARLAMVQAGGLRAAFGSDGKSLQVGLAASAGVHAARMAAGGAVIETDVATHGAGFAAVFGTERGATPTPAIDENWIKPWPCCLLSHSAVEAAAVIRAALAATPGRIDVVVHPVARRAAAYDEVENALQAKFSIPYLVAWVIAHGEPEVESFAGLDADVQQLAQRVRVVEDDSLRASEAVLLLNGDEAVRVRASRGSPERPLTADELMAKYRMLGGERLEGLLDDPAAPARTLLEPFEVTGTARARRPAVT